MARIRAVKPELWSSPGMKECRDPYARLLFIAMWNWADDCGRGTANPRELAGFAFPHDEELSSTDIRRMLGGIRRAFGVVFYEVDGRTYYAIPSWDKHQKIDKRSGAKHPTPTDGQPWNPDPDDTTWNVSDQQEQAESEKFAESSADPAEDAPTSRRIPGAGTGELGNRGTDKDPPAPRGGRRRSATPRDYDDQPRFVEFWGAYPLRKAKPAAFTAWKNAIGRGADPDHVIAAAKSYRDDPRRKPDFTAHPATWLNNERYDDQPASAPPVAGGLGGAWWDN